MLKILQYTKKHTVLFSLAGLFLLLCSSAVLAATSDVSMITFDSDQLYDFLKKLNPFSQGILKFLTGTGATDCPMTTTIMGLIVNCMSETVHSAVDAYAAVFFDAVAPYMTALMTLAVILYGVEVALGEPQMMKKGFALIFRVGAVAMYSKDLNGNTDNIFATMDAAQDMVTEHLLSNVLSTVLGLFSCPIGLAINFATGDSSNLLWARLDCILMDMIGIGTTVTLPVIGDIPVGNSNGLAGGLFGILLGLLFCGGFGVACFMFGLSTLLSLVFFVMRVVYTFIVSYVLVGFLIVIAPLMIPFLLFPKYLGFMFDRWWMNLAGAMALPAMLFAFLSIVVVMLDVAVFNPYNPFALRGLLSSDEMQKAIKTDSKACQLEVLKDLPFFQNVKTSPDPADPTVTSYGDHSKFITGPYKNFLTPTQSGSFNICDYIKIPNFDFVTATGKDITQGSFLIRLAICLFTTMIVSMLTLKMYDGFATVAVGIFGGGGVMLAGIRAAPLQKEITGIVTNMGGGLAKSFGEVRATMNSSFTSMVNAAK